MKANLPYFSPLFTHPPSGYRHKPPCAVEGLEPVGRGNGCINAYACVNIVVLTGRTRNSTLWSLMPKPVCACVCLSLALSGRTNRTRRQAEQSISCVPGCSTDCSPFFQFTHCHFISMLSIPFDNMSARAG